MTVREVPQRVWRGRGKVLRLQRDLWIAQLAMWPAVLLLVVLLAAGGWAWLRRKSRATEPDAAGPPMDSPQGSPARTR